MPLLRHRLLTLVLTLACLGVGRVDVRAQDFDTLYEEVRVATARLEYALDKVRAVDYPVGADDRRRSKDLIRQGRMLMKRAAQMPRGNADAITEVIVAMAETRTGCLDFVESVVPVWQAERPREALGTYRSAFLEVLKFQDVAEDLERMSSRLTEEERTHADLSIREGQDLIAVIKKNRESDHVTRQKAVRRLMAIRNDLSGISLEATKDRTQGYTFVELGRSRQQWTNLGHSENGFIALRTRFMKPSSAYVTIRNDSDEVRHLFVEFEFFTLAGDRTGEGVFETASLEEFRPGEVREVLVPVYRSNPQFWERTRTFTIYLD